MPATTTVENLKIKLAAADDNIYTDVAFWGGVIPGNQVIIYIFIIKGYYMYVRVNQRN